jgi:hypothetical protein
MLKPMFMFVVKIVMLCDGQVGGDFVSHLLVIYVPFLHFFNSKFFFFATSFSQPPPSLVLSSGCYLNIQE